MVLPAATAYTTRAGTDAVFTRTGRCCLMTQRITANTTFTESPHNTWDTTNTNPKRPGDGAGMITYSQKCYLSSTHTTWTSGKELFRTTTEAISRAGHSKTKSVFNYYIFFFSKFFSVWEKTTEESGSTGIERLCWASPEKPWVSMSSTNMMIYTGKEHGRSKKIWWKHIARTAKKQQNKKQQEKAAKTQPWNAQNAGARTCWYRDSTQH